jgi:DNA-binding NarL/FixJ family response regulator
MSPCTCDCHKRLSNELTRRETEIRDLIVQGLTNKEIGQRLFIEETSVKFHVTNLFKKTGNKSRAQLIAGYYNGK